MNSSVHTRALVAIVLMTVGVIAFVINGVTEGWTTLGIIGTVCLAIAIAAAAVQLRGARTA